LGREREIYDHVGIYDTAPDHTTVSMVRGLVDTMLTYDSATVNVTGGRISTLAAADFSTANISGGASLGHAGARGAGTVNVSGGHVNQVTITGNGTVNISGDPVVSNAQVNDNGLLNISGGEVGYLDISDKAVVNLHGGVITDSIFSGRGSGSHPEEVVINVYGHDLVKTSSGGQHGWGQIYGFYPDGSAFSVDVDPDLYSHVNLIPEPATLLLLSSGVLTARACKLRTML
jgi:hypothetical protein